MKRKEHYILTRFNLRLWTKDKKRNKTRTDEWLKDRFDLFEKFCLPSIINQSCQSFQWIVLFDSETPECYKEKIQQYKNLCQQFCPCFVAPNEGRYFTKIYREEIRKRINKETNLLITTYLDNDDALHENYVEEIQHINVTQPTFVSFVYGLQYYTELNIATCVPYTNNHFISLLEPLTDNWSFRTVHGYGSHITVHNTPNTKTLFIDTPEIDRWIEVIHKTNMDNDVKMTFDTHLILNSLKLKKEYGINISLAKNSKKIFYTKFLYRAFTEIFRHIKLRIVGRKWD